MPRTKHFKSRRHPTSTKNSACDERTHHARRKQDGIHGQTKAEGGAHRGRLQETRALNKSSGPTSLGHRKQAGSRWEKERIRPRPNEERRVDEREPQEASVSAPVPCFLGRPHPANRARRPRPCGSLPPGRRGGLAGRRRASTHWLSSLPPCSHQVGGILAHPGPRPLVPTGQRRWRLWLPRWSSVVLRA